MFVSRTIINLVSIISLLVLVACGGGGGGDGGDGGGDTNPDLTAPSALVAVAVSDTAIDLSWSDNSGNEINFVVQRSTTSGSGFTTIATLGADVTTYSDTGLIPSTTYYYRVYATNDSGNSSTSNEASAATNNPPTANFPFSVGKQWTYNFNRSVTTVDSYSGVVNKVFAGQAVLYVEGQTSWQGRQAWRVIRYELESTPAGGDAFDVKIEYLYQDAIGLEKWYSGGTVWKRIISAQESSFGNNTLIMTRQPNSSSTTTQGSAAVTVPTGTYDTVVANAYYREGFTNYATVDHEENNFEYYADNVGLVKSVWDFWYEHNLDGYSVIETGLSELAGIDTGPAVNMEVEANDSWSSTQAIPGSASIVAGNVHIDDLGFVIADVSVYQNVNGSRKLEDWYTFDQAVTGPFLLSMLYQPLVSGGSYNDIDVYLFRKDPASLPVYVASSIDDPSLNGNSEEINIGSLAAGTYIIAIQANNTPTAERVDYWFAIH